MKLHLYCNTNADSATITMGNVIGRNQVRNFFSSNGYPLSDLEIAYIMENMNIGQLLNFRFRNNTKCISVAREV